MTEEECIYLLSGLVYTLRRHAMIDSSRSESLVKLPKLTTRLKDWLCKLYMHGIWSFLAFSLLSAFRT
jgi:hypothetical protein